MCTDERLSDKKLFPTFVRTIPPISRLAPPVHALMRHFNWTRVGILSQNTHRWSQWHVLVNNLRGENLVVSTVQTMVFGVHYNESGLTLSFEKLLQTAAKESRGELSFGSILLILKARLTLLISDTECPGFSHMIE